MTRIVKLSGEKFSLKHRPKLIASLTAILITGTVLCVPSLAETQRVKGEVNFSEAEEEIIYKVKQAPAAETNLSKDELLKSSEKNPYSEIQVIKNEAVDISIQKNEKTKVNSKSVNIKPDKKETVKTAETKPSEKLQKTISYVVSKGDTLSGIARRYNVDLRNLITVNRITNINSLQLGQKLIIPGPDFQTASRTTLASRSLSAGTGNSNVSGRMTWPTAAGKISSNYGMRWGRMHKGLDIAAPVGTSIKAAFDGKVTFAGWGGDYGNLIVVEHSNGLITKYGHCSKLYVRSGQEIGAGQLIGAVGSTGRSTGPHLHFETVLNGTHIDPRKFL